MSKITIQLKEKYKSFEKSDFPILTEDQTRVDLEGDLIILTGVNGSGKTQLLDIIIGEGMDSQIGQIQIQHTRDVLLNDQNVNSNQIIYKSFKDVLNPVALTGGNTRQNSENIAWNWFNNNNYNSPQYWIGYTKCKNFLLNYFTENQIPFSDLNDIEEFKKKLPVGFLVYPDDVFSSSVYNLFHNYLYTEHLNNARKGRNETEFLPLPAQTPWEALNKLFSDLNFAYRFENQELSEGTLELNEKPLLRAYTNETFLDLTLDTSQLSDGEKAIISLAVSSIAKAEDLKILLLDEYDATFNPTLTDWFYTIIKDFYIKKGVIVILTTHNPITATFAPTNLLSGKQTSFYEINKANSGLKRIIKKENLIEIQEIKNVLTSFYPQVGELEKEIEELKNNKLPILFVEGPTDKIILQNAWLKLYPNTPDIFYIPKTPDGHNAQRLKTQLERADCFQSEIVIGLFDFDSEGYNQLNGLPKDTWNALDMNTNRCFYRKNKTSNFYGLLLSIPNHRINYASEKLKSNSILSIELLFTDLILGENIEDEQIPGTDQTRKKFKESKKMSFAESTKDFKEADFENFQSIFETIEKIITTT